MPTYTVIQYRDATIRYETEIEADTPQAALERAKTWDCLWTTGDCAELDHADMEVRDALGAELIPSHEVW